MNYKIFNKEYFGLLASLFVATLSINSMPLLVGGVIEGMHLNSANAGLLASIELGSVAAATLYLSRILSKYNLSSLGIFGGIIALIGNISCWITSLDFNSIIIDFSLNDQTIDWRICALACGRILAGVGAGAALAAFSSAVSSVAEPDQKYARVLVANVTIIGLLIATLIPFLQNYFSYRGTFTALAIADFAAIFALQYLPTRNIHNDEERKPPENKIPGVLLIMSLSIFAIGEGAVWAFVEQVGRAIDINKDNIVIAISSIIGLASIVGVFVGAGGAALLGLRIGRKIPLNFSLFVFGIAGPLLSICTSQLLYVFLIFAFIMSQYFLFPYYMGAAAELDTTGQWAAASTGMYLLGSTFGPVVAGKLVQITHSYESIGWLVFVTSIIPILMMHYVFSLRKNNKHWIEMPL